MIEWALSLNSHELEVLRTFAVVIGSAFVPVFGLVLTWVARAINKNARDAKNNTETTDWRTGKLRSIPVAEHARQAVITGVAARQETADLSEWVRGSGRRRLPTTEIERQEPSTYE